MTVGEKLKEARKNAGLTQEQMAEKLMVSRQAITKWESDKGMPDIGNLKAISGLLNISIDYLLDDGTVMDTCVFREAIDLSAYGSEKKKLKKDKIVNNKYPNAAIITLLANQVDTKWEKITDNMLGFLTDAPFGIPSIINGLKNLDKEFYLVEQGENQFLVMVTDEFIESRKMTTRVSNKPHSKFQIGDFKFTVCRY